MFCFAPRFSSRFRYLILPIICSLACFVNLKKNLWLKSKTQKVGRGLFFKQFWAQSAFVLQAHQTFFSGSVYFDFEREREREVQTPKLFTHCLETFSLLHEVQLWERHCSYIQISFFKTLLVALLCPGMRKKKSFQVVACFHLVL